MMTTARRWLWLITLILLLAAAARVLRSDVVDVEIRRDEVKSVLRAEGSVIEVIDQTPPDWTPLYFVTLAGWKDLVGEHPIPLRFLGVLSFLLGTACLYRLLTGWHGRWAGLLGALAWSALGYTIFLSIELRGYALLLGLQPAALWLLIRYFERPHLRNAALLGTALAGMFAISLTSVPAFAAFGLFSLVAYRRRVWRGWLPGGIALGLAAPLIWQKLFIASLWAGTSGRPLNPDVGEAFSRLYERFVGAGYWLYLILFGIALVTLLLRRRLTARAVGVLLWVASPVVLYWGGALSTFFQPRYAWWVMLALALWLGIGLAHLPRPGRLISAAALTVALWLPLPLHDYQLSGPPLGQTFLWLRDQVRWGDVFLVDPANDLRLEEVDYLARLYFPNGLLFVDTPGDHRRIWYLTGPQVDETMRRAVLAGRVPQQFFGPAEGLFRLYEAPPDPTGIPFENGLRFHGAEVLNTTHAPLLHTDDRLHLRLWWSLDRPLDRDYSVSVQVFVDDRLRVQDDSAPRVDDAPTATSQWQTDRYYYEDRVLDIPNADLAYADIMLAVYFWQDQRRLTAPGVNADGLLPVERIVIRSRRGVVGRITLED